MYNIGVKGLGLFLVTLLVGCGGPTISCDSTTTKETINQIVRDKLEQVNPIHVISMMRPEFKKYSDDPSLIPPVVTELNNIIMTGNNEQTGSVECKSNLTIKYDSRDELWTDVTTSVPITYTVETTSEGRLYVTVVGL
jgi:hypothetical protein